jgi:hypothetical protein
LNGSFSEGLVTSLHYDKTAPDRHSVYEINLVQSWPDEIGEAIGRQFASCLLLDAPER